MADVFISYARADRDRVERIANALKTEGFTVWWDTSLKAGETFDDVIERELALAKCVVVAWSTNSVSRRWVRNEARVGLNRDILVPIFLEDVEPPIEFSNIHTEDLSKWKGNARDPQWRGFVEAVRRKIPVQNVVTSSEAPEPESEQGPGFMGRLISIVRMALIALIWLGILAVIILWFFDGTLQVSPDGVREMKEIAPAPAEL